MKSNVATPLNKLFACKRPVFVIILFTYYRIDFSKSIFFPGHSHSQHIMTLIGMQVMSNHTNEELLQLNLLQSILTLWRIYITY